MINIKDLRYWLEPKQDIFTDFGDFVLDDNDLNKNRIFIDRGSLILFVAHIDAVHKPKFIRDRKTKYKKLKRIYAHGLDDRLGCMIAYQLSEELNTDLLICDNEESCRSTGQFHELKDYNWIAEFDREGKDVVTYDLDNDKFRKAISESWKLGFGSFSDILKLQTTACCMNVGIGHRFSHSKDSYVEIKTMNQQVIKFKQFYNKHKDTKFVRDENPYSLYNHDRYSEEYYADKWGVCEVCGLAENVACVFNHDICQDCFETALYQFCYIGSGY